MARSAHAYLRGSTVHFYQWLHSQRGRTLPHGPNVWICGDCHVGNLGPIADRHGRIDIHIRDLDQSVIGNPVHDLVRLALSLATAVRGSDLPGVTTAHMLEAMMRGYEASFEEAPAGMPKRPPQVQACMRDAVERTWKHLAHARVSNTRPSLPLGRHFWPLSRAESAAIEAFCATPALQRLVSALQGRAADARVAMLDSAFWVKGCSSLGLLRYAVLLSVGEADERDYCLIDVKEAVRAAAPRGAHVHMPRDNAHRVLEGARQLSPTLGKRMMATRFLDHGVFVRELLPQDLKLELDTLNRQEAMAAADYLARVLGIAHARQMDEGTRKNWLADLRLNRSRTLDAPSWLWTSVVQLIGRHEEGYLEHCRRYMYALGKAQ
ncbi:Uncharacterized conserved protein, DUF2252 family [Pseudomonas panipatensis]|uniref:Uncharacterized conserved protein, DUF2252 family n=2 Tax=Pseudomonas panipatensis TaxID=428992 RepID=A0A1G8LCA4_9PSED|nr:Uncharacterized conserved protein, DUF2252 family [Pseudomonas panipatensis]SMP75285.1 Uncharacterized conserved protein, DUF2252 family [Pseudomonas panipatensis]